jgi:glutamine synthetase
MVRVPGPGRFEYRLGDGAANPYLLQAALLAAGLDGVARELDPGHPLDRNMYESAGEVRRLPLNLLDAVRAFSACAPLRAALGEEFCAAYEKLKLAEWDSYMHHLSAWERAHTLDC